MWEAVTDEISEHRLKQREGAKRRAEEEAAGHKDVDEHSCGDTDGTPHQGQDPRHSNTPAPRLDQNFAYEKFRFWLRCEDGSQALPASDYCTILQAGVFVPKDGVDMLIKIFREEETK